MLKTLCISHQYHPESQGALDRWHQMLKAMLRKYCMDTSTDWDEGVAFVLFAIRETIQESLGFSPADLVFGHTPRGLLKVLKEHILLHPVAPLKMSWIMSVRYGRDCTPHVL